MNDEKYVPPDLCNSLGCNRVCEAVFGFKKAGLKLRGVTMRGPKFMQSVTVILIPGAG